MSSVEGSIQSALSRINAIQSRMESLSALTGSGATGDVLGGDVFGKVLSEAIDTQNTPTSSETPTPDNLDALIQEQSAENQIDPALVKAVIRNESNFNPKAVSPVGAEGLMQLMPGTAKGLGVTDSFDPTQNIAGGSKYLKTLLNKYDQSVPKALAAYNAGPGAVDSYGDIPPYKETQQYVQKVLKSYQNYQTH